jgi:preprotein translocase subunit YajC
MTSLPKTLLAALALACAPVTLAGPGLAFAAAGDAPALPASSGNAGAQEAAPPAPQQPGFGSMLPLMLAMFAIMYFVSIRPKQKEMQQQQQMLSALKDGDEIITTSGILGKVTGMAEKVVTVEIAPSVRVKMLKSQVTQVVKGDLPKILKDKEL